MNVDILEELVTARRSCRAFLAKQVPRPQIERMLTLAQRTPSWCNSQAWQVHLTSGAGTERFREALYEYATSHEMGSDFPEPAEYHGVYKLRRREAGFALYASLGIAKDDHAARLQQAFENFRFFGAPHVAVITSDRALGTYGAVDCGGYVATLLLAAESLGISAIPQAAIALHSDFVRAHFGLPDDRAVLCAVSFGYADELHLANGFRTTRAELVDVVDYVDN
jgi:nitroreductase